MRALRQRLRVRRRRPSRGLADEHEVVGAGEVLALAKQAHFRGQLPGAPRNSLAREYEHKMKLAQRLWLAVN